LLEKPAAVSEEECQEILEAQKKTGAKVLVGYRLHFDPATLALYEIARNDIGKLVYFQSYFSQPLKEDNHRGQHGYDAGPVPDMGIYSLNAVRALFGEEPLEVSAVGFKTPNRDFDFHDTVTFTMRFPEEKSAVITTSYSAIMAQQFSVIGTKGQIDATPCFGENAAIKFTTKIEDKEEKHEFKPVDQFAGETQYFSECIINGTDPVPDVQEGLRDVRVIAAVKRALETGETQKLAPLEPRAVPNKEKQMSIELKHDPSELELVGCEAPH